MKEMRETTRRNEETLHTDNRPSEEEGRAITEQVHRCTFRLVDLTAEDKGGTCVAVNVGNRFLLATAGHVIPDSHRFEVVLKEPRGGYIDRFVRIGRSAEADVGFLEIEPPPLPFPRDCFLPEDRISPNLSQEQEWPVLIVGYPGQYLARIPRKALGLTEEVEICSAFTFCTTTLRMADWPEGRRERPLTPGRDVLAHHDPEPVSELLRPDNVATSGLKIKARPPAFFGVSGGGIWLEHGRVGDTVWAPSARLIGLQVSRPDKGDWVRGTVIDEWLKLVLEHYPELAPNIAAIGQAGGSMTHATRDGKK